MLHEEEVCQCMKEVSFKDDQSTLQKTITWIKKSSKGSQVYGCQCHCVHSFECSSMTCNELVFNL
jgi:hypothetical protein